MQDVLKITTSVYVSLIYRMLKSKKYQSNKIAFSLVICSKVIRSNFKLFVLVIKISLHVFRYHINLSQRFNDTVFYYITSKQFFVHFPTKYQFFGCLSARLRWFSVKERTPLKAGSASPVPLATGNLRMFMCVRSIIIKRIAGCPLLLQKKSP